MARKAEKAICNETDIIALTEMRDGAEYPEEMRRRARIILLSHGGKKNKEISAEVGMGATWVGKWVRRFNEGGIGALRGLPRSGRRGNAAPADVASEVAARLASPPPEGEARWTAALLAEDIGVSEGSVRNAARASGATIERRRVWEVATSGEPVARTVDVAGLFLSGDERALVLAVGGDEAPAAGTLTTRNGSLAADALSLAAEHASDGRRIAPADLGRFLDGVLSGPPGPPGSLWSVLLLCGAERAAGLVRRPGVQVTLADGEGGWEDAFAVLASVACGGGAEAAGLGAALAVFLGAQSDGTETFLWARARDGGGSRVPGDDDATVAETDGAEAAVDAAVATANGVAVGAAAEGGTAAGATAGVAVADDAAADGAGGTRRGHGARITVEYLGEGGEAISSASVEVGGLMDPGSCDTSSRESVAGFASDLERALIPAIDAAGRALGDAALAATKKNSR